MPEVHDPVYPVTDTMNRAQHYSYSGMATESCTGPDARAHGVYVAVNMDPLSPSYNPGLEGLRTNDSYETLSAE